MTCRGKRLCNRFGEGRGLLGSESSPSNSRVPLPSPRISPNPKPVFYTRVIEKIIYPLRAVCLSNALKVIATLLVDYVFKGGGGKFAITSPITETHTMLGGGGKATITSTIVVTGTLALV